MSQEERQELESKPTLSVAEAAKYSGIGRDALYEAISRGDVKAVKFGRRIRVLTKPLLEQLEVV
jgi:excisionase family DNA binding protein